jgi:hypothetical protein
MIRIIRKSISLANAPSLTEGEYGIRARDWAEQLFEVVPEDRLFEAFGRAVKDHNSSFPVNFYDLKAAWHRIETEEAAERQRRLNEHMAENPVKYCKAAYNHVDQVNDDGEVTVMIGGPNGKEVIIPCPDCRTEASHRRLAEEKAKLGGVRDTQDIVIDMFSTAASEAARIQLEQNGFGENSFRPPTGLEGLVLGRSHSKFDVSD